MLSSLNHVYLVFVEVFSADFSQTKNNLPVCILHLGEVQKQITSSRSKSFVEFKNGACFFSCFYRNKNVFLTV